MRTLLIGLLTTVLTALVSSGQAADLEPFAVQNLSPPALVRALAYPEPFSGPAQGEVAGELLLELANHALIADQDQLRLVLDGETAVATLRVRYGLGQRLRIGFDLPWINHSGGFMDNLIRDWHDWFGLPNGDRDRLADDDLNFSLRDGSEVMFHLDRARSGFGDLRLHLGWEPQLLPGGRWSLQAQLKAPTGDPDRLTGSGSWDFGAALAARYELPLAPGRAAAWFGAAINRLGAGEILPDEVEDWVVNGWLGAGWSPLEWLALKLQVDGHSPLYASRLEPLGDPAWILTFGGNLVLDAATELEISVAEDLQVNASPDVVFRLGLRRRF